jgi:hypothetical protein
MTGKAAAGIITLLTDFGSEDVYVGVLKGIIATINPQAQVIDLTHQIPPQNIWAGRFCLMTAVPFFPAGTVHLAVVDPGVGSARRAIAIQIPAGFLVGPDNGLFSGVLSQTPALAAIELNHPTYWRTHTPSFTFHGRDLFAPVAAHLASGTPFLEVGSAIDPASLVTLPDLFFQATNEGVTGVIQAIDRFGNLISTIPAAAVQDRHWSVQIHDQVIPAGQTYGDSTPGEPIALIGSHGWVEVAINQGSAQQHLGCHWGEEIRIVLDCHNQ